MNRPTQPGADWFQTLRERHSYALAQDAEDRKDAQEDVLFAAGGLNQWDPRVVKARKKRPVLTENRLGPSIAQVVNDGRQNKPSITVMPMDGGTEETAEYFQSRIRHIQYECDADIAYDTAREQQVTCGRGWLRITTKRKPGYADKQCLSIDPIENQFSVIWDPSARRYDLQDARWMLVIRRMSIEDYEREHGKDNPVSRWALSGGDNPAPGWVGVGDSGREVQIADYYERTQDEEGNSTVKIYVTNGCETLDETDWIGSTIPVLPMWGKQLVVEGRRRTYSLIRNAKDPQRLVNLYVSNIAEQIAQMPKTPYLVAEGQILGREKEWETINEVARSVVQYKTVSTNGQPCGPPTREINEPPIQALVTGYLQAVDAIKASMGIYDASLGAGPADEVGIVIQQRRKESDVTNFHFADNEARTLKAVGRILVELIPIVDGTDPQKLPVRSEDGRTEMIDVNQPYTDKKKGKTVHHDMSAEATYGVGVSSGPSFTSQRDEENQRIGQMIQAAPDLMWVMGDLYFGSSNGPGAQMMAERMRRAIQARTPNLVDDPDQDPRTIAQQALAKVQQLGALNEQLTAEVHNLAQIVEAKKIEQDGKFQIEALHSWTQLKVAEIAANAKTGIADADREGAQLEQMFDQAHEVGMAAMGHAHEVLTGAIDAAQQAPAPAAAPDATQPAQQDAAPLAA